MLTWKSKIQTIIALSSAESEYVSLSQSMRDVIPIMDLLRELQSRQIVPAALKDNVR